MADRERNVDGELGRHVEEQGQIARQIDIMLAYGPINLGLSNIVKENPSEERIKEDLGK